MWDPSYLQIDSVRIGLLGGVGKHTLDMPSEKLTGIMQSYPLLDKGEPRSREVKVMCFDPRPGVLLQAGLAPRSNNPKLGFQSAFPHLVSTLQRWAGQVLSILEVK